MEYKLVNCYCKDGYISSLCSVGDIQCTRNIACGNCIGGKVVANPSEFQPKRKYQIIYVKGGSWYKDFWDFERTVPVNSIIFVTHIDGNRATFRKPNGNPSTVLLQELKIV